MWDDKPFVAELEKLGEAEVRAILARGDQWANLNNRRRVAQEWLRSLEDVRTSDAESRKEARDEESLYSSRLANKIAIAAIVFATITAISAAVISVIYANHP